MRQMRKRRENAQFLDNILTIIVQYLKIAQEREAKWRVLIYCGVVSIQIPGKVN